MEIKIGLALGGGGARGSYQIGVLEALRKTGILKDIKHVSGTSIGAINALMVMANFNYDQMLDVWKNMDNKDIYGKGFDRLKFDKQGLFSLQDVFDKMSEKITLSEIRESKIKGYATAARIKKGNFIEQVLIHRMEKEVFYLNEFKDPLKAVLASASIPILFGSTHIDDEYYVDGGALDNCPVTPLIEAGCNVIFAVPIEGRFPIKDYYEENILLIDVGTNFLFNWLPYDVLDFQTDDIKRKAMYGEKMGLRMIAKLAALRVYTKDKKWNKNKDFEYISLSKLEEKEVREEVDSLWT